MTYLKAILDVELFDVEDIITTSGTGESPEAPSPSPEVTPPAVPLPPVPRPEDGNYDSNN